MNTLMTHQQISCIDRPISLRCPPGTNVIIKVARYANASPGKDSPVCDAPNVIKSSSYDTKQTNCEWPSALQYSLLQTAVEVCRSKEQCQFQVSLGKFGVEPCPGSQAQVEVEYNCRPYSFSSKVGCEHEKVNFECEPNTRLAIYSASYGRTQYQSVQCPQPQGVAEETCLLSYATEIVIEHCHGKRNCTLVADSKTFTNPCKEKSRVYLKVVYACVPRKVLLQKFEEGPDQDEYPIEEVDQHDILDNPESLAPSPDIAGRRRYNESNSSAILLQHPASNSVHNTTFTANKEKMYIYLVGSVSGIVISLVIFVIVRVIWSRKRSNGGDKYQENAAGNTTLPHSFNDEISEVDADITLAEVMPPVTIIPSLHHISPPGEVVRYGKDGITPRSLCQNDNNQYYYG
ncbi:protein eva-1 homolog C isoform X2 [Planococcus citri]